MSKYAITNITNFSGSSTIPTHEITISEKDIKFLESFYVGITKQGLLHNLLLRRLQDEMSDVVSSSRSVQYLTHFNKCMSQIDYSTENKEVKEVQLFSYLVTAYYFIPTPDYISSTNIRQAILDAILLLSIQKESEIMKEFVFVVVCSRRQLRDGIQYLLTSKVSKYNEFIKHYKAEMAVATDKLNNATLTPDELQNVSAAMELALDLELQFNRLSYV